MSFFFQAEDGIRDIGVTRVQTCALPIYVRLQRARPVDGLAPVGRLAHDGDVLLAVEQGPQSAADQPVVVGQQHPDHDGTPAATGGTACTRNPPATGPASSSPPSSRARSRMLTSPWPDDGCATGTQSLTTSSTTADPRRSTATRIRPAGVCLTALVSASCAIRYTARAVGAGSSTSVVRRST